MTKINASAFP